MSSKGKGRACLAGGPAGAKCRGGKAWEGLRSSAELSLEQGGL